MFHNRRAQLKGITLVELMVSIVIFSLMSVALGIILNIGLKSWRDIDGKVEAESGLNNVVKDINDAIRNSQYSMIYSNASNIYNGDESNIGHIILPSYVTYNDDHINEQEFNFVFSSSVDSTGNVHFNSSYNSNFMVAYFVLKYNDCPKCNEIFGSDLGLNCPHKMLVKKWYKVFNPNISNEVPITQWSNTEIDNIKNINGLGTFMANRSLYDKILSQNIMAFGASLDPVSHMISYRIKSFKPNISKTRPSADNMRDSVKAFYNPSITDPLKKYCIEIHSIVAPLNQ